MITVTCPVCGLGIVDCEIDPGEPEIRYTRNGDGSPGVPASVADWEADCGCSDSPLVDVIGYALALEEVAFAIIDVLLNPMEEDV